MNVGTLNIPVTPTQRFLYTQIHRLCFPWWNSDEMNTMKKYKEKKSLAKLSLLQMYPKEFLLGVLSTDPKHLKWNLTGKT